MSMTPQEIKQKTSQEAKYKSRAINLIKHEKRRMLELFNFCKPYKPSTDQINRALLQQKICNEQLAIASNSTTQQQIQQALSAAIASRTAVEGIYYELRIAQELNQIKFLFKACEPLKPNQNQINRGLILEAKCSKQLVSAKAKPATSAAAHFKAAAAKVAVDEIYKELIAPFSITTQAFENTIRQQKETKKEERDRRYPSAEGPR